MMDERDGGLDRRQTLKCMLWAGTGVVWTVAGGVPSSRLIGAANAAEGSFSFVQISDSHIGFEKPANPDARATLNVAIDKVIAMPDKPALMIHTGDISHSAKPVEFDDALQLIGRAKFDVHYSPGEHDILDPKTRDAYLERFGKGATGGGWYSFDHGGVHFVSLNNVVDLKKNGLGSLGADQLGWLEDDLRDKSASTPIVVFCHIPLWMIAPEWGWGTEDSAQALGYLARFGSVTVLNGHIHQLMQKVEGNVTFHTARSTAFPQPAPGTAPSAGPKLVPAGELRKWLGVREVVYSPSSANLAVTDLDLS
jgi:3',5'-cyclic-AMP phosphodiesterase